MSEFEQDPSANTGRFRAFVEGGSEEDAPRSRRSSVSPVVLVVVGVVIIAVIAIIVGLG
jgi:hypothetical protein